MSLSLIASGWFSAFWLLLVARLVAGVGAGLLFIGGVAVVLALDASHRSDLPVGVYYAGPGIGIAVSGMVVPWLLGALGWEWRAVWVALGALGLLAQLLVEPPLGRAERATQLPASATTPRPRLVLHDYLRLWPGLLAYALFGLGYIGYMTFVIAFLRASTVASIVVQGFWVLLGSARRCAASPGGQCYASWRRITRSVASSWR